MKILITGGAGFIGSYFSQFFSEKGHQVAVMDPQSLHSMLPLNIQEHRTLLLESATSFQYDVCDADRVTEVYEVFRPDLTINLASISLALGAELNVDQAVNLSTKSIKNIFNAAKAIGSQHIIHFSSSYVYGDFQTQNCDETHPLNPVNVYGRTKHISEILCRTLADAYNLSSTIIRPISVYGLGDFNGKLSTKNIKEWIECGELRLHGGQERINTITHLEDIANAVLFLASSPKSCGQTYNISSDEHLSNGDIQNLFVQNGYQLKLSEPVNGPLKVPVRGRLSINKARNLGFQPQAKFASHLPNMIRFAK
jgi:nucleoside-diphosphate-sugar epimerase